MDAVANDGQVTPVLFNTFATICLEWEWDSQAIEGVNSRIKLKTAKSRRLGLDQLTADIVVSNLCALGTRNSPGKWSLIKPIADAVLDRAIQAWDVPAMNTIRAGTTPLPLTEYQRSVPLLDAPTDAMPLPDLDDLRNKSKTRDDDDEATPGLRWTAPPATPGPACKKHKIRVEPDMIWGAQCSLRWYKEFQPRDELNFIKVCFTIGKMRMDKRLRVPRKLSFAGTMEAWMAPLSFRSTSHCLRCLLGDFQIVVCGDPERSGALQASFTFERPVVFKSSDEVYFNRY